MPSENVIINSINSTSSIITSDNPNNNSNNTSQLDSLPQAGPPPLSAHIPPRDVHDASDASPSSSLNATSPASGASAPQFTRKQKPATSLAYDYPPAPTYPTLTPILHRSPITILSTPEKGRGVFATEDLPMGFLVDISPVLLLSSEEYYGGGKEGEGKGVEGSVLRGYVFTWKGREGGMALALGVGSMFNHATSPNVSFELKPSTYTIHYKTFRPVLAGEELCIFYGHKAVFNGNGDVGDSSDEDEGPWGGLDGLDDLVVEKPRDRKKWDQEIVPFDELEWSKVTSMIDPENQPLITIDCWAADVPARHTQLVFQFARKHAVNFSELNHLKRVRKVNSPGAHFAGETMISVLLFPVSTAPANLTELLANSPIAFLSLTPYVVPAPSMIARTAAQALEWGEVWPVTMVHIREGPRALPKSKGWERVKKAWIKREGERVWKAAKDAATRGEALSLSHQHPIACHVTDSFDTFVHSSSSLPKTLVRAHDTRISTRNILSHAASNAIDAIAILDRQGLREAALRPDVPAPYLLTGLTVFMSHEPCLLCAMSLLHSRISNLFYIKRAPGSGGCGSLYSVHEDEGLNHRFEVWEWNKQGGKAAGVGEGLDLLLDP
ncbi:tRNA-specific adenosine deaminase 3, partial [Phenoliferia sp. Uapishka_3]